MFSFRTWTICLKLRGVPPAGSVLQSWSWLRVFPVSSSFTHQFPDYMTTQCSHGMKRNIHKESTQSKSSTFFPAQVYQNKRASPSQRRLQNLQRNQTEYGTSRLVLLHWNCKTRGKGTERNRPKPRTQLDSLWIRNQRNSWTAFYCFLFFVCF